MGNYRCVLCQSTSEDVYTACPNCGIVLYEKVTKVNIVY